MSDAAGPSPTMFDLVLVQNGDDAIDLLRAYGLEAAYPTTKSVTLDGLLGLASAMVDVVAIDLAKHGDEDRADSHRLDEACEVLGSVAAGLRDRDG